MTHIPSWVYDHPDVWVNPWRLGGAPCIRGSRLLVDNILNLMLDLVDDELGDWYHHMYIPEFQRLRRAAIDNGLKVLPITSWDPKHETWLVHQGLAVTPFPNLKLLKQHYGVSHD